MISQDQTDPFILNLAGGQPVAKSVPSVDMPKSIPGIDIGMAKDAWQLPARAPGQMAAIADVLKERARQDQKWGEQNHDPILWAAVLGEEFGEFAQAALHHRFGGHKAAGLREEAVQVAAVALAIIECLDRNGYLAWKEQEPKPEEPEGLDSPPERCECGGEYDHCDDSHRDDDKDGIQAMADAEVCYWFGQCSDGGVEGRRAKKALRALLSDDPADSPPNPQDAPEGA